MSGVRLASWRNRDERRNLWIGFGSSVVVHLLGATSWLFLASALLALNRAVLDDLQKAAAAARQRAQDQVPTVFVEVLPEQETATPPENTPFYSSANSRAANPDPPRESLVPQMDGSQDKVVKTYDSLRPNPEPPKLAAPPQPPAPQPQPEPQREPPQERGPGDPAIGEPQPPGPTRRPQTLAEARLRYGMLAGPKMKQEGGVRRPGAIALDAKASPFGAYDAAVIAAIQERWYDLLDESTVAFRSGKVVVEFTMHYDGRVTDLQVVDQDVGEILALYCRKAVSDPAPFARWPEAMRKAVGRDHRDVRVTFYYL